MEILKIVIPKWNIAEITGYDPMTTFWQDFSMADKFGKSHDTVHFLRLAAMSF